LQEKYDVDNDKHIAALEQSGFTLRDYNIAIVKVGIVSSSFAYLLIGHGTIRGKTIR
jgi:hypothetical protein